MIPAFKLSAKPFLVSKGAFKGELQTVEFIAVSPAKALHWFAVNCGQLERVFGRLVPQKLAKEIVDLLSQGREIEFPGLYLHEQLSGGFHCERSPTSSGPGFSSGFAPRTEMEARP